MSKEKPSNNKEVLQLEDWNPVKEHVKRRGVLAMGTMRLFQTAYLGGLLYGIGTGDYTPLKISAVSLGPLIGIVFEFYFRRRKGDR